MKKFRFFFLLLVLLCFSARGYSQDLLYLATGDTLRGKIEKINKNFIYFYPEAKGQPELKVYSLKEISEYSYNQYNSDQKKLRKKATFSRFHLEAGGGISWYLGDGANFLLAPVSQEDPIMQDYMKKFRLSSSYSGAFCVFLSENIGINVRYSYAAFSNSIYVLFLDTANQSIPGYIKDDLKINYIAPGLTLNWPFQEDIGYIQVDLNLGYLTYANKATVLDNYGIRGETFGFNIRAGGGLAVAPGVYITISAGFISAQLPEIELEFADQKETFQLDQLEYLNASRLDFHAGLAFRF